MYQLKCLYIVHRRLKPQRDSILSIFYNALCNENKYDKGKFCQSFNTMMLNNFQFNRITLLICTALARSYANSSWIFMTRTYKSFLCVHNIMPLWLSCCSGCGVYVGKFEEALCDGLFWKMQNIIDSSCEFCFILRVMVRGFEVVH